MMRWQSERARLLRSCPGLASDLALRLWNRQHSVLARDGDAVSAWADLQIISPLD
jgi:hypothetical protein